MDPRDHQYFTSALHAVSDKLLKQISFPSPLRGLIEITMFAGVFAAA